MSSSGGKDPTKKQGMVFHSLGCLSVEFRRSLYRGQLDTSGISRFLRKPKALWNRIRSRSPDPKRSSQTTLQNDSPAVAGPSNARITTPAESTETFDDTYAQTPTASSPPSIVLPMKDPGTLRSPLSGTGPTITKDASTPPPVSTAPSKPP